MALQKLRVIFEYLENAIVSEEILDLPHRVVLPHLRPESSLLWCRSPGMKGSKPNPQVAADGGSARRGKKVVSVGREHHGPESVGIREILQNLDVRLSVVQVETRWPNGGCGGRW